VYAARFRHLKAPRKLQWRPTLGLVELTLSIGDSGPLDFRVTPVHAALLLQFADDSSTGAASSSSSPLQQQPPPPSPLLTSPAAAAAGLASPPGAASGQLQQAWVMKTAGQLGDALGVPLAVVRRKAMFWVGAGVLLQRRGPKGEMLYYRAPAIDPSRIGE
jgi:hypothetical protein